MSKMKESRGCGCGERWKKGRADTCNYRIIGFCATWDTTKKWSAMTMTLTTTLRADEDNDRNKQWVLLAPKPRCLLGSYGCWWWCRGPGCWGWFNCLKGEGRRRKRQRHVSKIPLPGVVSVFFVREWPRQHIRCREKSDALAIVKWVHNFFHWLTACQSRDIVQ